MQHLQPTARRIHRQPEPAPAGLFVTVSNGRAVVSIMASNFYEERKLAPLMELVQHVLNASLAGPTGAA